MPPRQRYSPIPSTKTALSVDCPVQLTARFRKTTLFRDSHDTCPRTFHARGHFPGRSCVFPGDLPCQGPFSWKVLRFSGGPSMPAPVFPEGPAFFRGTFHARSHFPGRSCVFQGDLPCQSPFSWKVLPFSGGPSMLGAIFPEGPAFFRGTFHARGHFPGRSCVFQGDLPRQGPFSWKVLRFSGGPSMLGAIFPEGPAFFRGTFHARSHFPGRSCFFQGDLPCQGPFSRKVPVQVLLVCAISGHLERKTLVLLLVYTISGHLEQ